MKNTILFLFLSLGLLFGQSQAQSVPRVAGYVLKNASYQDFICLGSGKNNFQQGTTPFQFTFTPVSESGNIVLISNGGQFIDLDKVYMRYDPINGFAWSGLSETAINDSACMWVIEAATNDTNAILRSENPPLFTIRSAIKDGSNRAYLGAFFSGQSPASGNFDVLKSSAPITYNSENAKAFWFLKKADLLAYKHGINSNIYADTYQQVSALQQAPISGQSAPKFSTAINPTLGLHYINKWGTHNFIFSAGNKTYTASSTVSGDSIAYSSLVEYQSRDSNGFNGYALDTHDIYFTDGNYMKYAQFGTGGIIDSFKIGPATKEYSNPVIWTYGKAWVVDSDGILHRYGGHSTEIPQLTKAKPAFMHLILYMYGKVGYYGKDGLVYRFTHTKRNVYGNIAFNTPAISNASKQKARMYNNVLLKYPNTWVNLDTAGTAPFQYLTQYNNHHHRNDWIRKSNRVVVCQYDSILHSSQLIYLKMMGSLESPLCLYLKYKPKGQELVLLGDSMRPIITASNPVLYSGGKKEDGSTPYYLAVVALDGNGNYQLRQYKLPNFEKAGSFNSELSYVCDTKYVTNPKVQKLVKIKANIENLDAIVNRWHNDSQTEITNKQVRKLFDGYCGQIMQLPYNSYSFQKNWNFLHSTYEDFVD